MTLFPRQFHLDAEPYGALLEEKSRLFFKGRDAKKENLHRLFEQLPCVKPSLVELDRDRIIVGRRSDPTAEELARIDAALRALKPWRKGPFDIFGIQVDSEWNSALKWHRVAPHIASLSGRRVLDVGCSNGYYLLRMASQAPRIALGIEPYAAYYYQFQAIGHFLDLSGLHCLPLRLEDLDGISRWFDTVFCMGILYHRRSPMDTLARLKAMLRPGGQLVLETLIIDGDQDMALFPRDRYACMRNVFFIPTVGCLQNWMARCGLECIRCVDVTVTTIAEQRKTPWIDSDSLDSCLNPDDQRLTVEGYPAPVRAVVIAEAT